MMISSHRIAHDLSDKNVSRSKDVALDEDDVDLTFKDLMLSKRTLQGLSSCGFERPSPIQLKTIPLGRCGFDLVVQSKAGTGKTCIFAVVALEALQFNVNNFVQTLIVSPTREIASQIFEVVSSIGCYYTNVQCALCIGGTDIKQDRANLTKGSKSKNGDQCQIIIGTPGRLKHLIDLNVLHTQSIELFVLDEADKLMDEQFKVQIDEIYKRLPEDKQMIVTSATYPDELSSFLQKYMQAAKYIRVGDDISLDGIEEYYVESKAGHSNKKSQENKFHTLRSLLFYLEFKKCFIFTNYQARAPMICDFLNSDKDFSDKFGLSNYLCAELSQHQRNVVFGKFKNSDQKLLVSTDISARGIDIDGIDLVINFDLPHDGPTYFHRIGRAGRFGQAGKAVSIVSSESIDRSIFNKNINSSRINKLTLAL